MVRPTYSRVYPSIPQFGQKFSGDKEIINAPAQILAARSGAIGPPRGALSLMGVNCAKGVDEASGCEFIHPGPLLGEKPRELAPLGFAGMVNIDVAMANIEVTTDN